MHAGRERGGERGGEIKGGSAELRCLQAGLVVKHAWRHGPLAASACVHAWLRGCR